MAAKAYNDLAFAINTRGTSHGTKSLDSYITHIWIFHLSYTFWILEYFTRLRLITSYVTMNIKLRSFSGKYWFSVDKYSHLFVDIHSALRGNSWDGLRVVLREIRQWAKYTHTCKTWKTCDAMKPKSVSFACRFRDHTRSRNLQNTECWTRQASCGNFDLFFNSRCLPVDLVQSSFPLVNHLR